MFRGESVTPAGAALMAMCMTPVGVLKLTVEEQIAVDWEMARRLDVAGDKYKSEGKMDLAKTCYYRASCRASRAHNAQVKLDKEKAGV